jgi:hypothetical protein
LLGACFSRWHELGDDVDQSLISQGRRSFTGE